MFPAFGLERSMRRETSCALGPMSQWDLNTGGAMVLPLFSNFVLIHRRQEGAKG